MIKTTGLSLSLPHGDAWPFKQLLSPSNVRYYLPTDEVHLPDYSERFWLGFNGNTMALATLLWNKGCHPLSVQPIEPADRQSLQSTWNFIKVEERKIRKAGLSLSDVVTGDTEVYQDTAYQCPWANFDAFEKEMNTAIQSERMYVLVPQKLESSIEKMKETVSSCKNSSLCVVYDTVTAESGEGSGQTFSVLRLDISAPADKARREAWISATRGLAGLFLEKHNATPMQVPEFFRRDSSAKRLGINT